MAAAPEDHELAQEKRDMTIIGWSLDHPGVILVFYDLCFGIPLSYLLTLVCKMSLISFGHEPFMVSPDGVMATRVLMGVINLILVVSWSAQLNREQEMKKRERVMRIREEIRAWDGEIEWLEGQLRGFEGKQIDEQLSPCRPGFNTSFHATPRSKLPSIVESEPDFKITRPVRLTSGNTTHRSYFVSLPVSKARGRSQVKSDIDLHSPEIDSEMRDKIVHVRVVMPTVSVSMARDAITACDGNLDDAINLLAGGPFPKRVGSGLRNQINVDEDKGRKDKGRKENDGGMKKRKDLEEAQEQMKRDGLLLE